MRRRNSVAPTIFVFIHTFLNIRHRKKAAPIVLHLMIIFTGHNN